MPHQQNHRDSIRGKSARDGGGRKTNICIHLHCSAPRMSPPILLLMILSVFFGALTTVVMLAAMSTDYWENTKFDSAKLRKHPNLIENGSLFYDAEGFYKIVLSGGTTSNRTTYILRDSYGGIWKICDYLPDSFRRSEVFADALKEVNNLATTIVLQKRCFNYITDYAQLERKIVDDSALFRIQNSAASCSIVGILCLATAIITGTFGLWKKQLSACMITGVMYIIAGVFQCFTLIIMLTKMSYEQNKCHQLVSDDLDEEMCDARLVTGGWSLPIAWVAFCMSVLTLGLWLLMSRCYRIEAAKSLV